MNTETTDVEKIEGWVLYDGGCRLCTGMAERFEPLLARRHFKLLPLQTPWVQARLALAQPELLAEMRLLKADGQVLGGADAMLELCRYYPLSWPVYRLGKIPAVKSLFHRGYRWIARNRNCIHGACKVQRPVKEKPGRMAGLLPMLVLTLLALGLRARLAPWVFMWEMALALYTGAKWATYREAVRRGAAAGSSRRLGYWLLWPGMAATEFLDPDQVPQRPRGTEWVRTLGNLGVGLVLLYGAAWRFMPDQPLLAGWSGMTGCILVLHFGLLHVVSLLWRRAGIAAAPIMQTPLKAGSLADFWGSRWNTAFSEIAFQFAYQPLRRRVPPALATLLVFGISGAVHELVISVPARAGYGLPTGYFLLQGLGVIAERTRWGRGLGLGEGVSGWCFTLLVTAGPAFWLFPPPFIQRVILPMLTAIGAT